MQYQIDKTPVSDIGDSIVVDWDGRIVAATAFMDDTQITAIPYLITITCLDEEPAAVGTPSGVIPYDENSNLELYNAWKNDRENPIP